jgi:hypothetical protein
MPIPDDVFVADAVSHAYNLSESNFRIQDDAVAVVGMIHGMEQEMPDHLQRTPETLDTDWSIEDTFNMLFRESQTDMSVFHPQTINVFHDGMTANYKAGEIVKKHPERMAALGSVDMVDMDDPEAELERQADEWGVHGVKVYPSYWDQENPQDFFMDDPDEAFPMWQKCADLGLDVVAVHKAIPFGKVPTDPYKTGDIDDAAASFPELNFEIVHGGLAFAEETAYQLTRFPNVYVNLEVTAAQALVAPKSFQESIAALTKAGGEHALNKLIWGTGAADFHPQALIEAFWEFDFGEMGKTLGTFEITKEDKRKILGENFLEAHNFDKADFQDIDDEYSKPRDLSEPFSTTSFEVVTS